MSSLRKEILCDLRANGFPQSGASAFLRAYLFHLGFYVLLSYRIKRRLILGNPVSRILGRFIDARCAAKTGCFISPYAIIEPGVNLPHATGIVIGIGVKVAPGVTIYQQVTLGESKFKTELYPDVAEGSTLYAGVKVIGAVRIGRHVSVGANAVVLSDIPDFSNAAGVPARFWRSPSEKPATTT